MLQKVAIGLAYFAGAVAVLGGTILLVAYGKGYSYDFKSHRLEHKGLVILESTPSGAKLEIDGKDPHKKTPYRNTFLEGQHTFSLTKDGYRTWSKVINVVASEVSLAQYVILFPENLKVDTVSTYPNITFFVPTKDHRHIAYNVVGGGDEGVWSIDTGSRNATKLYSPKPASGDTPDEIVQSLQWSDDGSHALLRITTGDKASWIIVGSNGSDQPINVSQNFGFDFPELRFNPTNWRELYWLSPEGLRRLDISAGTMSAVLADHVIDYSFAGDRIAYIDDSQPGIKALWSLDRGGHKQKLVDKLPSSDHYQMQFEVYRGTDELAILPLSQHTALVYDDIFGKPVKRTALQGVDAILFNGDGHFLTGYSGANIATYDIEKSAHWNFAPPTSPPKFISWLDSYHLIYDRGGQTVVSEFDGGNTTSLLKSSPLPSFNSGDGKEVWTVLALPSGNLQIKSIRIRQ